MSLAGRSHRRKTLQLYGPAGGVSTPAATRRRRRYPLFAGALESPAAPADGWLGSLLDCACAMKFLALVICETAASKESSKEGLESVRAEREPGTLPFVTGRLLIESNAIVQRVAPDRLVVAAGRLQGPR